MPMLEVRDLKLQYSSARGVVKAVDGVSFDIEKGEALGIVGESGSGKTSLSLALMRVLPKNVHAYEGQVTLDGKEITGLPDETFRKQVRWRQISMVFQGAQNSLNPVLKVGFQAAEPMLVRSKSDRREARKRVEDLFEMVGLPREIYDRYPHELSGGMKQRVGVASALVLDPRLIILDEPTSALDVSIQAQIMNLLKRLKRELGLSMIFITHDIALSSDICDHLAVLYAGEVVEKGSAEQIFGNPKHPYTQLLLASVPRLKSNADPRYIPGAPPDLTSPPPGCRFHPRCPYRFEPCDHKVPPQVKVDEGQTAKCWLNVESERVKAKK
ncbi:MAG: ABC transporter ATP-binding protein [Thaumarchaeota archaeon]|nr:ABC transporter ATP-binding protein [Nitrososphaerota archaeon]MCL5318385.1 ABC transporter ATP-binding protein [Nitrososphaerota archaeon]